MKCLFTLLVLLKIQIHMDVPTNKSHKIKQ
uniref:Uncharacterized protein n=1 Tax=Anguilla anguilla TaxID=7936 RepID=A0A0E9SJJ8_ANGAN